MIEIFKNIVIFFMYMVLIGLFMKVVNYVGECIGFYNMIRDLWKRVSKNK